MDDVAFLVDALLVVVAGTYIVEGLVSLVCPLEDTEEQQTASANFDFSEVY